MRIIVIEDEILVRKGIVSGIDWASNGVQVVGEAADGLSGLELVRTKKPDMVLTDIKMPIMDGLEMIRQIRYDFPEIIIMILSIKEDFQSVQEALRLGVIDYVHKLTMSPEELLECVLRVKNSIGGGKPKKALSNSLLDWLRGGEGEEIQSASGRYSAHVIVKLRVLPPYNSGFEQQVIKNWESGLFPSVLVAVDDNRDFWFLVSGSDAEMIEENLRLRLEGTVRSLGNDNYRVFVGVSSSFKHLAERVQYANQAAHALELHFFPGFGSVRLYPDSPFPEKKESFLQTPTLKEYVNALDSLDERLAMEKFNELLPEAVDPYLSPQRIRDAVFQWQSSILLLLDEWGLNFEETFFPSSPYDQIAKLPTYAELRGWCLRLHSVAFDLLTNEKKTRHREEIERSIRYIRTHYHLPLRVQDVASEVNLSENYFSYLFAKNTGKTFVHFLQEIRVEKAKELLRRGDGYWFSVGERVGFENPKYFSKIFKKYTRLTPAQYKRMKAEG